jgi:hypothetical protein
VKSNPSAINSNDKKFPWDKNVTEKINKGNKKTIQDNEFPPSTFASLHNRNKVYLENKIDGIKCTSVQCIFTLRFKLHREHSTKIFKFIG